LVLLIIRIGGWGFGHKPLSIIIPVITNATRIVKPEAVAMNQGVVGSRTARALAIIVVTSGIVKWSLGFSGFLPLTISTISTPNSTTMVASVAVTGVVHVHEWY
jgi:hypothetical protein